MRRLILMAFVLLTATLYGQGQQSPAGGSGISLDLSPGIQIPTGDSGPLFGIGGSALFGARYSFASLPLFLSATLGYDYDPLTGGLSASVSVASASAGAGVGLRPLSWLTINAGLSGGYSYSFLSGSTASGADPFLSVNAAMIFLPGPMHVNLGVSYRYYFHLYSGVEAFAGLSYDLFPAASGAVKMQQTPSPKPQPLNAEPGQPSVQLKELSFDDIYPVFRTYYATHPLGKVVLSNGLNKPISDIKVTFQIKEFMTDPTDCQAVSQLAPGQSSSVNLYALFLPAILDTSENSESQASINVDYTVDGQPRHMSVVQAVSILKRNATSWVDNRRAAAFVTTSDPAVLFFSKNVNGMVKGKVSGDINANLLLAMALFEALQLYGLSYSADPIPTQTSSNQVADYIQFPRQTLDYKGGKCSDFSVLYNALLESVGIETAFITIPGHIFVAFCTGVSPDEARRTFSHTDDLIVREDKSWIPVEVTERAGFLQAWQGGAKEWRENLSKQQAAFYQLHDAWKTYEPVGISGTEVTLNLPASDKVMARYLDDVGRFVDGEISSKVAALESQIQSSPDSRKPTNALGVLYARYGQFDRAQQEFEKILSKDEYVPALLNWGNILYLRDEKEKALDYYNRAYAKDPENPNVILAVAKTYHDLENYYEVKKLYEALKQKDPDLALKFAYLDLKGEEATRAAEANGVSGIVIWQE